MFRLTQRSQPIKCRLAYSGYNQYNSDTSNFTITSDLDGLSSEF